MKELKKLIELKSLVFLLTTLAFIFLAITKQLSTEFLGVYTICVGAYFSTSFKYNKEEHKM